MIVLIDRTLRLSFSDFCLHCVSSYLNCYPLGCSGFFMPVLFCFGEGLVRRRIHVLLINRQLSPTPSLSCQPVWLCELGWWWCSFVGLVLILGGVWCFGVGLEGRTSCIFLLGDWERGMNLIYFCDVSGPRELDGSGFTNLCF